MNTPTAAFTWELWRRHRTRLLLVIGVLLAFILVYPELCKLAGFNAGSPDATDEMGMKLVQMQSSGGGPSMMVFARAFCVLFLTAGPGAAMVVTLLWVIWVFTFTELDKKTKDPMAFPGRLFILPVSTAALFWRLLLGGLAVLTAFYLVWICCVQIPHLEVINYRDYFVWATLLVLTQGVVWSLAARPITRMLILMALLFSFLAEGSPEWRHIVESPFVLTPLFLIGVALGRVGLQKMRHGQWQGRDWHRIFSNWIGFLEWRGPKRFSSPAQAQLWFEWRRSAGVMCLLVAALALVPVSVTLLLEVFGCHPLRADTMGFLTAYLAGMPVVIFFCQAISPGRMDPSFLLIRPLASGDMVMAMLKASALSVVLSWVAVLAAFAVMPWLGDFHAVTHVVETRLGCSSAIVGVLIFLTWRIMAVQLCLTLTRSRWAVLLSIFMIYAGAVVVFYFSVINHDAVQQHWLALLAPLLAFGLVIPKFLLASVAFHTALRRRLLTPCAVARYLVVWSLLVIALLSTVLFLVRPEKPEVFLVVMGVILIVPLARIGLCPLALSWSRHRG